MSERFFHDEFVCNLDKNYTVGQILNIIKSNNFKFKIKKTNTPILNQSFYGVSNKKFRKFKIKMSNGIEKDITETLNMLKQLY